MPLFTWSFLLKTLWLMLCVYDPPQAGFHGTCNEYIQVDCFACQYPIVPILLLKRISFFHQTASVAMLKSVYCIYSGLFSSVALSVHPLSVPHYHNFVVYSEPWKEKSLCWRAICSMLIYAVLLFQMPRGRDISQCLCRLRGNHPNL